MFGGVFKDFKNSGLSKNEIETVGFMFLFMIPKLRIITSNNIQEKRLFLEEKTELRKTMIAHRPKRKKPCQKEFPSSNTDCLFSITKNLASRLNR